jgi:hypothetical protein
MHVDLEAAAIVEHIPDLAEYIDPSREQFARVRPRFVASLALTLVVCGCGHRATAEDCGVIVDRYVEVELNGLSVTDPTAIDKRKAEMRVALKDDLARCPGKRITDSMVACFRNARTNAALVACTRW